MKISVMTQAALALSFGVAVQAQEATPWYVTAAATISTLDDARMRVTGLPTPAGYVLTEHQMKTGYGGLLGLGRSFGPLRVELEAGNARNRSRRYVAIVPPTGAIRSNGEHDAWRAMANAYFDFGSTRVRPFLGAGAGWTRVHIGVFAPRAPFPNEAPLRIVDDNYDGFAWQVMGGAALQLSPRFDLSAQYRWHSAGNLTGTDLSRFPLERRHAGGNVDVGLRLRF